MTLFLDISGVTLELGGLLLLLGGDVDVGGLPDTHVQVSHNADTLSTTVWSYIVTVQLSNNVNTLSTTVWSYITLVQV